MELDKYYQDMIDNILNGASDREQLEIILKLVSGLKEWNMNCGGYCELLYYKGFNEIQHKIMAIRYKEDYYNSLYKAIRDYNELDKLLFHFILVHNIQENKYGALSNFIREDNRFSITNDLVEENMIDFWFKDILLTIKKDNDEYKLFGIEVYDKNGNLIDTFDNIEDLNKKVEVLDNERETNY